MSEKQSLFRRKFYFNFAEKLVEKMTATEKLLLGFFVVLSFVFSIGIFAKVYQSLTFPYPDYGGEFKEAIIGLPRFINPLLAITQADKDLTKLVYAGLTYKTPQGQIKPLLAEDWQISEDGKTYTFKLKKNLYFHDGEKLTADDVVFTITRLQDPLIKSPLKTAWDGIEAKKIDEYTVEFRLPQKFATFLDNTTIGILPQHLWENVPSESFSLHALNTNPVGAGAYKIKSIKQDKDNVPLSYTLESFGKYALAKPYIDQIQFVFVKDEQEAINAYLTNQVDAISGITPKSLSKLKQKQYSLFAADTPRIFYLFFNHTKNKLYSEPELKKAIELIIDKNQIKNLFLGFANPQYDFLPKNLLSKQNTPDEKEAKDKTKTIQKLLKKAGLEYSTTTKKWEKDGKPFVVKIDTAKTPELTQVAENVSLQLEKFGLDSEVNSFELSQLNQNIIRPRVYESLLFGQVIKSVADLYAFWHSSQREDPGLNIAMYANPKADELLEKIKQETDKKQQQKMLEKLNEILQKDTAAIPLYSPKFIYITNPNIKGIELDFVSSPEDRFNQIHKWYIKTQRIWNFLKNYN